MERLQLRCPACFTGLGETSRGKTRMSMQHYRRLLDELGDTLWQVSSATGASCCW
jgi:hypothetical protein